MSFYRRLFRVAVVTISTLMVALGWAALPASADGVPTLSVPATTQTNPSTQMTITPITLNPGSATTVNLDLSVTHGTLSLPTTGLTFTIGDGTSDAEMAFSGTTSNVQTALNALQFTPTNAFTGNAVITYKTIPAPTGYSFNPQNSHFYKFVSSDDTWTQAKSAADGASLFGMQGYLATITSSSEQTFVHNIVMSRDAWVGAENINFIVAGFPDHVSSQTPNTATWYWMDGPESGDNFWNGSRSSGGCDTTCGAVGDEYQNWASDQPNGAAQYGYMGTTGTWADAANNGSVGAFMEEFGGSNGDESPVDVQTTTVSVGSLAPDAPASLHLTPGDGQIVATWPAVSGDIDRYKVEYKPSSDSDWVQFSTPSATHETITGLVNGTPYDVRVSAHNDGGYGSTVVESATPMGVVSVTPPAPGISAPIKVGDDGTVTTVPVAPNTPTPVAIAATPSGNGSWSVAPDGGVFAAGDAPFDGSMGGQSLNAPMVGISPTPSGNGYLLVGSDGGVFTFGDASFQGSMGGHPLNAPVTSIASTCSNNGYYLIASDGGVFTFGDAAFLGSMGGTTLNRGMIGIVPSCDDHGYWTFAADGGVFTFGDAQFYGSLANNPPAGGVIGMVPTSDGQGYWLIGADHHAYPFGDAVQSG